MMKRIIKWLVQVLYKTKTGHDEFVHLRAVEMGSRRSEAKKKAAKERIAGRVAFAKKMPDKSESDGA